MNHVQLLDDPHFAFHPRLERRVPNTERELLLCLLTWSDAYVGSRITLAIDLDDPQRHDLRVVLESLRHQSVKSSLKIIVHVTLPLVRHKESDAHRNGTSKLTANRNNRIEVTPKLLAFLGDVLTDEFPCPSWLLIIIHRWRYLRDVQIKIVVTFRIYYASHPSSFSSGGPII